MYDWTFLDTLVGYSCVILLLLVWLDFLAPNELPPLFMFESINKGIFFPQNLMSARGTHVLVFLFPLQVELNRTLVDKDARLRRQAPILWCPTVVGYEPEAEGEVRCSLFVFPSFGQCVLG